MHSQLGGAMGTLQSPADPLFWSHHAYIDFLLTIYLKCRVGFGKLSDTQKMNNPYAFVQCPHREDAGFFTSTSTITMRDGKLGANAMQANQPGQDLYAFYKDLPNKFYQLSDITTLGTSSRYMYQVGGLVGQMATQCDASGTGRRLHEMEDSEPVPVVPEPRLECKTDLDEETHAPTAPPVAFQVDTALAHDKDAAKVDAWTDEV
jgi:tyrosinase